MMQEEIRLEEVLTNSENLKMLMIQRDVIWLCWTETQGKDYKGRKKAVGERASCRMGVGASGCQTVIKYALCVCSCR